jgi:type II secretion system protein H
VSIETTHQRSVESVKRRDVKTAQTVASRRAGGAMVGFTLIELILVLALLAIVLAVSAPSLANFFKGRGLDNEARRFLALTRAAQARAVAEGVPMVLWFDANAREYGLNADKSYVLEDSRAERFPVEKNIGIEIQHSAEARSAADASEFKNEKIETTGVYSLRFNPDGFPSAGSPEVVILRQEGEAEMRVAQTRNRLSYEIQRGGNRANP